MDPVGAGSYPVDVIKDGEYGADIKMLSCKLTKTGDVSNSLSGEASLGQKFEDGDTTLDELFKEGKKDEIVDKWKNIIFYDFKNIYIKEFTGDFISDED